jgi:hypothetical protein
VRDLLADPGRERHRLVEALQLNLGQDQACVVARELANVPDEPFIATETIRPAWRDFR